MSPEVERPLPALRAMLPDLDPEDRAHFTDMAGHLEAMERHLDESCGRIFPDGC